MAEAPGIDEVEPSHHIKQIEQAEQPVEQPAEQPAGQLSPPDYPQAVPVAAAAVTTGRSSSDASPLPAAFPKKRRGRPPGRPNMTVREADYEDHPLVRAWNAARGERAIPVVPIGIRAALTEQSLVHETQRTIFRMPSRETIYFVQGWITARHIASQRPSYVNGLLIHSRGQDAPVSCLQCTERRAKHALGPFLTCRVLPGSFHDSCSNCKWFDNTSACSLYTGPKPNRKRKAKEQPPPPSPAGVFHADSGTGNSPVTAPSDGREQSTPPQFQSLPQPQVPEVSEPPRSPVPPQAQSPAHANPHPEQVSQQQPEPEMMPTQNMQAQQDQQSNSTATPNAIEDDMSHHIQPQVEASGSEIAEARGQSESVPEQHFVLPKPDREEDAQEADVDDTA
ncbi:hypothetical protein MMYC01_210442 [Madurella mycetomatis]|uniref:Uncharacterized protein n=1 Tax=Madurella mycetomatis TaxID=100816 RepID=A0A175VQK5_9PEZI|nr:hypothetical protein MMYC01_210442 [Madurella mycetomatis]